MTRIGSGLLVVLFGATSTASSARVPVSARTITVHVGDVNVNTARLSPGVRRYLRYSAKDGQRTVRDIWTRSVSFETRDGCRQLHLTQRWEEAHPEPGAVSLLEQESWFNAATFRPMTQVRRATKEDGVVVSGFQYGAKGVVGMKDLPGNTRSDFSLSYDEWPFNFEYDMELFETLPLGPGLTFSIPFYDAGIDQKSARYEFKVVGSARIAGWDGREVDCWLMTGDYHSGEIKNRFWFEKRSHTLIREEAPLKGGGIFVKTLLPPEAGDRLANGIAGRANSARRRNA